MAAEVLQENQIIGLHPKVDLLPRSPILFGVRPTLFFPTSNLLNHKYKYFRYMLESQPTIHKRPSALTSKNSVLMLGWLSILLLLIPMGSSFATASDIRITSPSQNSLSSTSLTVSGTFTSPSTPTIIVSIAGTNTTASVSTGSWSVSVTVPNGWHIVRAIMFDSNGVFTTSTNFFANDGSSNIAQVKYPVLNIEYSQVCRALLTTSNSTCPPLNELIQFDNSTQSVSGKFVHDVKKGWIRTPPMIKNAELFYTHHIVCVDCQINADTLSTMQTIFIEPSDQYLDYVKHNYYSTVTNNTQVGQGGLTTYNISTTNENNAGMIIYHKKYVDDACMSADIVYSRALMLDTIKYLESGCKVSNVSNTSIVKIPNNPLVNYNRTTNVPFHKFVLDSPYSSLVYKSQISHIKSTQLGLCINGHVCHNQPVIKNNFDASWSAKSK